MVDVKLVTNKTLVRDDIDNKDHTIVDSSNATLLVESVLWVDVVEREQKSIHQGNDNSINRLYEITMAYLPDTGTGTPVTAHIEKITTDGATSAVQRGNFNNFRVNNIGMNAMPTNYNNSNVTYNCFFWSHGATDGTDFDIYSQRVTIEQGEDNEDDITLLDGATTFEYSTTVKMQTAELVDTHDVFFVVT